MYRIIGADQKEYGPVAGEELRRWIAEGRANARTLTRAEGAPDWKPLGSFPEFAAFFAPAAPPPPPFTSLPAGSGASGRTNGKAVAGLVLAILGLMCCGPLFSTLGLIFSLTALSQIRQSPLQGGRELAIAGVVLSLFGYFMMIVTLFFFCLFGRHGFHAHHFYHL